VVSACDYDLDFDFYLSRRARREDSVRAAASDDHHRKVLHLVRAFVLLFVSDYRVVDVTMN
jgi:hypothetical protein